MKKKAIEASGKPVSRERLNQWMDAMALIIVRRQMRRYWGPTHRVTLSSII